MLVVFLIILILFVGIYKFIAISSIKVATFAIDFFLVFFYTICYFDRLVSVKISSGNAVYFWDCVFGIIAVAIYGCINLKIHRLLPKVSKTLDYIISIVGVSVAIPLAISFSTTVVNMFNSNIKATVHIQLLNNPIVDKIGYIIIFVLLAFPVWNVRMEKLNT